MRFDDISKYWFHKWKKLSSSENVSRRKVMALLFDLFLGNLGSAIFCFKMQILLINWLINKLYISYFGCIYPLIDLIGHYFWLYENRILRMVRLEITIFVFLKFSQLNKLSRTTWQNTIYLFFNFPIGAVIVRIFFVNIFKCQIAC